VLAVPNLDKKNENGSKCVRLCNERNIISRVQRWEIKTSSILVKVSQQDWEELQNL